MKTGITNAASLLPVADEDLLNDIPIDDIEIEREKVLERLKERNFMKRQGLYSRLW